VNLALLAVGAYAIYVSTDWLVAWVSHSHTGFISAKHLGWLVEQVVRVEVLDDVVAVDEVDRARGQPEVDAVEATEREVRLRRLDRRQRVGHVEGQRRPDPRRDGAGDGGVSRADLAKAGVFVDEVGDQRDLGGDRRLPRPRICRLPDQRVVRDALTALPVHLAVEAAPLRLGAGLAQQRGELALDLEVLPNLDRRPLPGVAAPLQRTASR
jgi:hypothetical protein